MNTNNYENQKYLHLWLKQITRNPIWQGKIYLVPTTSVQITNVYNYFVILFQHDYPNKNIIVLYIFHILTTFCLI